MRLHPHSRSLGHDGVERGMKYMVWALLPHACSNTGPRLGSGHVKWVSNASSVAAAVCVFQKIGAVLPRFHLRAATNHFSLFGDFYGVNS